MSTSPKALQAVREIVQEIDARILWETSPTSPEIPYAPDVWRKHWPTIRQALAAHAEGEQEHTDEAERAEVRAATPAQQCADQGPSVMGPDAPPGSATSQSPALPNASQRAVAAEHFDHLMQCGHVAHTDDEIMEHVCFGGMVGPSPDEPVECDAEKFGDLADCLPEHPEHDDVVEVDAANLRAILAEHHALREALNRRSPAPSASTPAQESGAYRRKTTDADESLVDASIVGECEHKTFYSILDDLIACERALEASGREKTDALLLLAEARHNARTWEMRVAELEPK